MAQVTAITDSFNAPQYAGELFCADVSNTPLLSMIGGLSGGLQTESDEFSTAVLFDYPAAKQPAISEAASVTAPTASFTSKIQETNVTQIFQETLEITYMKLANRGKITGLNQTITDGVADEKAWQIEQKLRIMARDVEHTFINGTYNKASSSAQANKTRGLIELCTVNNIDAGGAALSEDILQELYKGLADNGAYLDNMVIFVNSKRKQELSSIYQNQLGFNLPASRNEAGVAITQVETDFFRCGIVYNRFVPTDTLLIADIAHLAPVFQVVPEKGTLFLEELAKSGASEKFQLFGLIGLAHGPAFLHGVIKGLKTS